MRLLGVLAVPGLVVMEETLVLECTITMRALKTPHLYLILKLDILSFSVKVLKLMGFLVVPTVQSKQPVSLVMFKVIFLQLPN